MFTMKNKDNVTYTPGEMLAALTIHSILFCWKCVVFCWFFNRFVVESIK